MQSGLQQGFLSLADGSAETENHRIFLRADGEKAGTEKRHHHQQHHDFDNRKAAAQRLGQRLRTGVVRCHRRKMLVRVIVFVSSLIFTGSARWSADVGTNQTAACAGRKSKSRAD